MSIVDYVIEKAEQIRHVDEATIILSKHNFQQLRSCIGEDKRVAPSADGICVLVNDIKVIEDVPLPKYDIDDFTRYDGYSFGNN